MSKLNASVIEEEIPYTEYISRFCAGLDFSHLKDDVITIAKHCLIDWFAISIAASDEPLTKILIDNASEEGCVGTSTVVASGEKLSARQAALINGTVAHALDYDDVNGVMGHPTAPVAAAVLALGECLEASGKELITAFVAGYETECYVGSIVVPDHYTKGFHTTGTLGTFGAAAGVSRLLGLDYEDTAIALGIAGTQASGLKLQFGTMVKPLHAGKAAENGLFAAKLAAKGFSGRPDILEGSQGFIDTQCGVVNNPGQYLNNPDRFQIRNNLFKYSASCYLTHSTITMLRELVDSGVAVSSILSVVIGVDEKAMHACNIQAPATGLEIKFSLKHLAALVLAGESPANPGIFTDQVAKREDLVAMREKITVSPTGGPDWNSTIVVNFDDGSSLKKEFDVGVPEANIHKQEAHLIEKFNELCIPVLGKKRSSALLENILSIDECKNIRDLFRPLENWATT